MPQQGSGKRHNCAIAANSEAEAACGEPVPHEHRTDHADQGARDDIAGMMGQQHQAADRDQDAYTIIAARARGQIAETAKASAKLVMA